MVFDLIAQQVGAVRVDRLLQQRHVEIADADVARLVGLAQRGERAQRFAQWHLAGRPVDQQQVDIVGGEATQALLGAALDRGGGIVARRQLGGEENLVAGDP